MRKWLIRIALPPLVVCTAALFNGGTDVETDFTNSPLLTTPPPPLT